MLRLISFILALGGLAVSVLGIWLMMGNELPAHLFAGEEPQAERKLFKADASAVTPKDASAAEDSPQVLATEPPRQPAAIVAEPFETLDEPSAPPVARSERVMPTPKKDTTTGTTTRSLPGGDVEVSLPGGIPQPAMIEPESSPAPPEPNVEPEPVFTTVTSDLNDTASRRGAPPAPQPTLEEQLYTAPIAYETPASASFNSAFTVTLAIDARENATSATGGLSGSTRTNIAEAEVQVTDLVRANLVAVDEAFAIVAENDRPQKLSKTTESVWRWKVTPQKSGPQQLKFEIWAVSEDDLDTRLLSFNDTVTVEVSRIGQAMFLAQQYNPIVVILAGFGSLLAGIFGVLRFFKS